MGMRIWKEKVYERNKNNIRGRGKSEKNMNIKDDNGSELLTHFEISIYFFLLVCYE